jgi:hypothetical protein
MKRVDRATVKAIELTAPGACRADAEVLYGKLRSGRIFGAFDEQEREAIWIEVLRVSTDCLIPSLYSFFEDLNYLNRVADCVNRLIELSPGQTLSSALVDRAFKDVNQRADQCVIQVSDSSFIFRTGSRADRVYFGIQQIWICAMRDFNQVPAEPKRKNLLANPARKEADENVLYEFATLAYRLGFESDQIYSLTRRSPDREIARNALLKARKPDRYQYDEAVFEDCVEQIVRMFSKAQPVTREQARAAAEADASNRPPKRCGMPQIQDHERDRLTLFLDKLHNISEEQCDEMSSFFIRRSVYFAYFGRPSRTGVGGSTTNSQPRNPEDGLAREEQERLARDEEERLAREAQERERLAREAREARERERLAREAQERAVREEQERLAREEQEQEVNRILGYGDKKVYRAILKLPSHGLVPLIAAVENFQKLGYLLHPAYNKASDAEQAFDSKYIYHF